MQSDNKMLSKDEILDYYRKHSPYTEPGKWVETYRRLPDSIEDLVKTVQNIIIHQFWIVNEAHYGFTPKTLLEMGREPNAEINLPTVEAILDKYFDINKAGFDVERQAYERVVGNCRDFTLMLTSFLRHKGIPARSRSGVAKYFIPDHYEDHFVCEYYNKGQDRWIRVDAQLDQLMIDVCDMTFNTLDVPHNEFLDAAESMDQVRLDKAPDKYGIDEYTGQKYLNYKLFSDAAHLAKLEITPWESWGFGERAALDKLTEPDVKVLHTLEEVIKNEILPDIQKLFTDNRDFIVPDMYKPFYLELPFFKAE